MNRKKSLQAEGSACRGQMSVWLAGGLRGVSCLGSTLEASLKLIFQTAYLYVNVLMLSSGPSILPRCWQGQFMSGLEWTKSAQFISASSGIIILLFILFS